MTACSTYGIYFGLLGLGAVFLSGAIYISNQNTIKNRPFIKSVFNFLFWAGLVMIANGTFLYMKTKQEGFRMLIHPSGERDRSYRPYINQEETTRYMTIYNPHKPYLSGLYNHMSERPSTSFKDHFNKNRKN